MPRGVSGWQRAPTPPRVGISRPTRLASLGLGLRHPTPGRRFVPRLLIGLNILLAGAFAAIL
jgi:hypothetical protein